MHPTHPHVTCLADLVRIAAQERLSLGDAARRVMEQARSGTLR